MFARDKKSDKYTYPQLIESGYRFIAFWVATTLGDQTVNPQIDTTTR